MSKFFFLAPSWFLILSYTKMFRNISRMKERIVPKKTELRLVTYHKTL